MTMYVANNKQFSNEVEQDMRNYQGRGLCYLPKSKAEADYTNRGLNNFSYPARTEFNNCFIIFLKYFKLSLNACFVSKKTQAANNGTA